MKMTDRFAGHEIAGHETSSESANDWGVWTHWVDS